MEYPRCTHDEILIVGADFAPYRFAGIRHLFDILTIVLDQSSQGKWYVSTLELQLASFAACIAYRSVSTLRVIVNRRMPRSLWGDEDSFGDLRKAPVRRRIPSV